MMRVAAVQESSKEDDKEEAASEGEESDNQGSFRFCYFLFPFSMTRFLSPVLDRSYRGDDGEM